MPAAVSASSASAMSMAMRRRTSISNGRRFRKGANVCCCWNFAAVRFDAGTEPFEDCSDAWRDPAGAVIPLHSHADPEVFYILGGSMKVFQDDGESLGW